MDHGTDITHPLPRAASAQDREWAPAPTAYFRAWLEADGPQMAEEGYIPEDHLEDSVFPNQLHRCPLSVKIYHYFKGQKNTVLAKRFLLL